MSRTALWKSIASSLRTEIAEGHYRPGDKLPTEAELALRFGVNRHTVRRALSEMAETGLVHSRRGSGVFINAKPTEYPIGRRVRFHQNLQAAGQTPERKILRIETRLANTREADALALSQQDEVHVYEGVSSADGAPLALFRSVFPAARFPLLPKALQETGSVTAALASVGVADYTRSSTRLTAKLATPTQALHLRIAEGAPILRTVSVNVDATLQPVEYGITWFAGDRISLTVSPE
ncbi:phosphonate metabolism transcriptional regulator PhnF [Actibacterium lipolyticum]|uniref:Putative transcriptional regulator PhnF n=1 Tax=Actibacterium lipolyticum TaxID=1524263 RepID=A0A238JX80_9RHOB|nr:phosphonate metabolism transcriptional regulator PhnF [Actibacterium lipolyticum]SMX34316.1 putative transcriptional regulator PhnF [Actibacterium lipolyticum]